MKPAKCPVKGSEAKNDLEKARNPPSFTNTLKGLGKCLEARQKCLKSLQNGSRTCEMPFEAFETTLKPAKCLQKPSKGPEACKMPSKALEMARKPVKGPKKP